jgi:hypothetical protein
MKSSVWIGKKGLNYWYFRFRDSDYYSLVLIGITVLICFILIFNFIIPELNNWFSVRQEVDATQQKIAILQHNINFINYMNKSELDTQLQTASAALPSDKNFGSMLQTLSNAAAKSGVSLNNFSFQVGTVTTPTQTLPGAPVPAVTGSGVSTIQMTIIVNGSISNLDSFLKVLDNSLPISEVTSINGSEGNVTVQLQFYEKPFPNISLPEDTQMAPLSASQTKLLETLSSWSTEWNPKSVTSNATTVVSSGSAVPLF